MSDVKPDQTQSKELELDLSALEKITRESIIVRSFLGIPPVTPPPAPRKPGGTPEKSGE